MVEFTINGQHSSVSEHEDSRAVRRPREIIGHPSTSARIGWHGGCLSNVCQRKTLHYVIACGVLVSLGRTSSAESLDTARGAGGLLVGFNSRPPSSHRLHQGIPDVLQSLTKSTNNYDLHLRSSGEKSKESDQVIFASTNDDACRDIMEEIACSAEEEAAEWSEHFGQRYNDIVPPKYKWNLAKKTSLSCTFSLNEDNSRKNMKISSMSDCDYVLLLDLDKCSFFGNDINDLGICLQWMGRPHQEVVQLYRMLLSPSVRKAYDALKSRHARLKVAIYTARSTLVNYRSGFRPNKVISVAWNPKFLSEDGQVYFPPHMATAADIMEASAAGLEEMVQDERDDIQKALERLLAARQNIQEALELDLLPDLVVTATAKEVDRTVQRLGYRPARGAVLWDDNERLRGAPSVVTVPPFVRLPSAQRARVLSFLEDRLPAHTLEPDLVEFMLGADPGDRALARDADGSLRYHLPEGEPAADAEAPPPWELPAEAMTVGGGRAGGDRRAADEWEDLASSVTPENECMSGR